MCKALKFQGQGSDWIRDGRGVRGDSTGARVARGGLPGGAGMAVVMPGAEIARGVIFGDFKMGARQRHGKARGAVPLQPMPAMASGQKHGGTAIFKNFLGM